MPRDVHLTLADKPNACPLCPESIRTGERVLTGVLRDQPAYPVHEACGYEHLAKRRAG